MTNDNNTNQAQQSATPASTSGNSQTPQSTQTQEEKLASPLAQIETAPPLMHLEFSEKQGQNQAPSAPAPVVDNISKGE